MNDVAKGKRARFEVDGENYYASLFKLDDGTIELSVTSPFENRPENLQRRQALETLCSTIEEMYNGNHNGR